MIEPGDELFIGLRADMLTRGKLPYQMHWELLVTDHEPLRRVQLQLVGDAVGHAEWRFKQKGAIAEVELEWSLRGEHPLLKKLSRFLRPAFEYNHAWSMQQGQCGLCAELKRRARLKNERPNAYWGI